MKLWSYIKNAMLQHPEQVICENKSKMSYKAAIEFAQLFAVKIAEEMCCAILCNSEMTTALALLGCFAAGVTAVPLSSRYGELHCKKILRTISPTAIITDIGGKLHVTKLSESTYQIPHKHPALIMCTSGTTGIPKGAMLSEENILTNVQDIADYFDIDREDTILISRPIYHCAVLTGEFLVSLLKGVKIHFYSGQFEPKSMLRLFSENCITVFGSTPTLLGILARFMRNSANQLRVICVSGECLSLETGERIRKAFPYTDIYHVYGLTEACPRVCYLPPDLFSKHPDSVGIPLKSVSLRIVKADGNIAGTNEEGVLWVHGRNIMLGYYNAPEQTQGVLKNGWLCTGDVAVIGPEGLLRIKGRRDGMIIRAGMNIYPQEVEAAMKGDPRVREVLAYGIQSQNVGTQIGIKLSGDFSNVDEVRQLCMELLPAFQIPSVIELVDELPRNGSGKLIRGG